MEKCNDFLFDARLKFAWRILKQIGSYLFFFFVGLLVVFLYFYITRVSMADFGTIAQSYEFAETNALAKAFCDMIGFLQNVIVPILGIGLCVLGIGAFQGKVNPVMLVSLALGLAVIKDPGIFLNIILPGMRFQFGCKCITEDTIYLRQYSAGTNNAQNWQKLVVNTGVDEDCNPIR
jgi:hypothetical protein